MHDVDGDPRGGFRTRARDERRGRRGRDLGGRRGGGRHRRRHRREMRMGNDPSGDFCPLLLHYWTLSNE